MDPNRTTTNESEELLRAELDVKESRAELARSLRQVGKTGENLLRRAKAELKPGLVIAAVVVGTVAIAGAAVVLTRRGRKPGWLAPQRASTFGVVAKAVGLWALRIAARKAAQELVARLEQPQLSAPAAPAAQ
jgi:hypothetical protein